MNTPNILLITTDQQHHLLSSHAGDRYVRTPHLDRLAGEGMRFDTCYCANPVCAPSRYALLTGHLPHVFNGLESNRPPDGIPRPRIADHVDTPTLGALLNRAGYETVCGGKFHIEGEKSFTEDVAQRFGFRSLSSDWRDDLATACAGYLSEPQTQDPFFLWASLINPHDICGVLDEDGRPQLPVDGRPLPPLPANFEAADGEPAWIGQFRDGTLGDESTTNLGLNRRFGQVAITWSDRDWRVYRAAYRHYMEEADRQIGAILAALDASPAAADTVVIFTSDHGDHDGEHRLTMKRSLYDAAVRVPLIVRWPGVVSPGSVNDSLINNGTDLLPTLGELTGQEIDGYPGESLVPALSSTPPRSGRSVIVSETVGGRMVRSSRYKYCVYHCEGRSEEMLTDMRDDPGEAHNLASDPALVDELRSHRDALAEEVRDSVDNDGKRYLAAL